MKSRLTFFSAFVVLLLLSSCGPRSARTERRAQGYAVPEGEGAAQSADTVSVLDRLPVGGEPYRLCSQVLTSEDGMDAAFPEMPKELLDETTPIGETFYFPSADIRGRDLVRTTQLRYNYVSLYNRIAHSYEWYIREAINIAEEEFTRKDTLYWIRYSQPKVSGTLLDRAIPDQRARSAAGRLLRAYSRFDGVDREGSPFDKAVADYSAAFEALPRLVSQEEIDRFGERFWDWYDKRAVVPEIDDIIRMNMIGYGGKEPAEDQINRLRQAVETEKDIDRRTILALEYVKFSPWDGVCLLGEILESRIYTKYLLEAWDSWRSNVQMNHSASSFSVIANNYYDRLRVICIDTMVRHCLECDDPDALCLLENLILCDIIHRMDSLAGNGSFGTVAGLSNEGFIHPRMLDQPSVEEVSDDSSLCHEHPAEVPEVAEVAKDAGTDWKEEIPVFHQWREIDDGDYYFKVPSARQVREWKALCEKRSPLDSVSRRFVEDYYADLNQFVTVRDFVELWYHEDSRIGDDELTTWRLMQYKYEEFYCPDSEYDKFARIRNVYLGLLCFSAQSQWEMNFQSGLEADFQEYYDRMLVREAVRHSKPALAAALRKEEESWLRYHAAVDSAFRVINGSPHGWVGSAWPMAIGGILLDNAYIRERSLADFYFALTDNLDYLFAHRRSMIGEYDIERHERVSDEAVILEYAAFKESFPESTLFDPEWNYPEETLRSVLDEEMRAWNGWMSSRKKVSSLLTGLCKDVYDNSTNNVRRDKLIMLKNKYQGYGLITEDTKRCLLPYNCKDTDIAPFSFEQRWNQP